MAALFRQVRAEPAMPDRPSHFGEDANERVPRDDTDLDYSTIEDVIVEPVIIPPVMPTPVYQVEAPPTSRSIRRHVLHRVYVDGSRAIQIAANNRSRKRLFVRALSTNTQSVYLLQDAFQIASEGFELTAAGNDDAEIFSNTELWARCVSGQSGVLNVIAEYEVEDV